MSEHKEYITTCTHTQYFSKHREETIPIKTIVVDVIPNPETGNPHAWFDGKGGYTFKIKGQLEIKWVYYDWFLVPNTPKNIAILDKKIEIDQKINELQIAKENLTKTYEQ